MKRAKNIFRDGKWLETLKNTSLVFRRTRGGRLIPPHQPSFHWPAVPGRDAQLARILEPRDEHYLFLLYTFEPALGYIELYVLQ